MLVILDTSTIIAALLSSHANHTRHIIKLADLRKIQFATCKEALMELKTVIATDSIKKYTAYRNHLIAPFVNKYQHTARFFNIGTQSDFTELRDVSDTIYLRLAVVSRANYLISGDKDLLILKKINKTSIVTPKTFIDVYYREQI